MAGTVIQNYNELIAQGENVLQIQRAGIQATHSAYGAKFDQVNKPVDYRLSEDGVKDEFDEDYEIKTLDLAKALQGSNEEKEEFAQELGSALQDIGFAILVGHGIEESFYDESAKLVEEMFTQTSSETKNRFLAKRQGSVNQGYFPPKTTSIMHPDLVEGWVFCRRSFHLPMPESKLQLLCDTEEETTETFWPSVKAFQHFQEYTRKHLALVLPIMRAILRYFGCEPQLYDQQLSLPNFGLRLNWYPPISKEDEDLKCGRMLGHEDVDLFTLLPAPTEEGLQVLNRRNNKWIRLHAPKGSIVLNTGDYMQRITNDILPSTTHRVSKPSCAALSRKGRVSMPMAIYLWEDELLEVLPTITNPKYSAIKALTFHTAITSKHYGAAYAVKGENLSP